MDTTLSSVPPAHRDLISPLGEALARAEFTAPAISRLLALPDIPPGRRLFESLLPHLRRTCGPAPLAALVRLFLLGQPVPEPAARAALHPLSVDDAVRSNLLSRSAADVRATVRIVPFEDLWVVADWPGADLSESAFEPVMGVAASTQALAQMMIHRPAGQVLDLGTGSGVLALLAARTANHVVAADLNPRAAAMTAFNAALNGAANVESRTGNLFDPVSGRTFDLILCNPPFVIAPTAGRMHSQTGRHADDLCRSIVQAAPQFLRPSGFCQLVGNWVHPTGGDWRQRLAGWFAGLDCDAWVLQARSEDAATYAQQRISETTDDPTQAAQLFDDWMSYYEQAGIEAVGFGVITLRRASGPGWFRCKPMPPIAGPCGDAIERGFAGGDFLAAHRDDAAFLAARVRRADDLVWDRRSTIAAGGWVTGPSQIRLTKGLMFAGAAEAGVAEFVGRCTGTVPLSGELARVAAELGRDARAFQPAFLGLVRRLIEIGILVPMASDAV